jgi:hypothetical protein
VERPTQAHGSELADTAARAVEQAAALRLAVMNTLPNDRVLALLDDAHRALRSLALSMRAASEPPSQVSRTIVPLPRSEAESGGARYATQTPI